jgi:hypothetical protein
VRNHINSKFGTAKKKEKTFTIGGKPIDISRSIFLIDNYDKKNYLENIGIKKLKIDIETLKEALIAEGIFDENVTIEKIINKIIEDDKFKSIKEKIDLILSK